jgi:DNA uptake protein ComE-like DNA-binding protein
VKLMRPNTGFASMPGKHARSGSTFVIVLWVAVGLVSLALYFANSMSFELKASDGRVSGVAAEQAIEGAARYITFALQNYETNGVMPDPSTYLSEAVRVGESKFWIIGRETNSGAGPNSVTFGLVDEAAKVNLNYATSNMLYYLPRMNQDLVIAILDWRDTNGGTGDFQTYYGMLHPPYQNKSGPFETIDEMKLLYGADMETLFGEDVNRNGVLDPNESDDNRNGVADPGLLEYVTVYSREPNTSTNGSARVNIRTVTAGGQLDQILQSALGTSRAQQVLTQLGLGGNTGGGRGRGGGGGGFIPPTTRAFTSPLQLCIDGGMSADEFAKVQDQITVATGSYINGRVNINTASSAVLSCLPGLTDSPDLVQTLINYRQTNPDKLGSIGWVVEALGQNNRTAITALAAQDCITTHSYQYSADVAAVGPYGRGYRRVRFVFDTITGTPQIVYRQDLTHLGWALGQDVRQTLLAAKDTR